MRGREDEGMENKETGEPVEDNDFMRMQIKNLYQPSKVCQHCYCGRVIVNGKDHMVCCMCGNRTLKDKITY